MAQELRALSALAEDQVPSTHMGQLSVTLVPEDLLLPFSGLCRQHTHVVQTHIQAKHPDALHMECKDKIHLQTNKAQGDHPSQDMAPQEHRVCVHVHVCLWWQLVLTDENRRGFLS